MSHWREPLSLESPQEELTTFGDGTYISFSLKRQRLTLYLEFPDDPAYGSGLQTPPEFESPTQWASLCLGDPSLLLALERTSVSTTPHHCAVDVEGGTRGRPLPTFPSSQPTKRSRSIPPRPQLAPAQIPRAVSMQKSTAPHSFLYTPYVSTPGVAVSPFTGGLSGDTFFAQHFDDMNRYINFDHDQWSAEQGNSDHTYTPLSRPLPPVIDRDDHEEPLFAFPTSLGPPWVPPAEEDGSTGRPSVSDNFLTGGDYSSHSLSAYRDTTQFPPELQPVPISGSSSMIDPSLVPARSRVEGDGALPPLTAKTTTHQMQLSGAPSVEPRKFRSKVGTPAMAEACWKRRKQRDGPVRLFVCSVPNCGRDFTARHNLSCMSFHCSY